MIAAIILAAGESSRMGSPKALLQIRGKSFLQHILDTTEKSGLLRVVALREGDRNMLSDNDLYGITVVTNRAPAAGPIGSIRAAIEAIRSPGAQGPDLPIPAEGPGAVEALLVWPVDFPLVEPATIAAVMAEFAVSRGPIVAPAYRRKRGHPVLFSSVLFDELMSVPDHEGARAVVRKDAARVRLVDVSDPAVLDLVNTAEAYQALKKREEAS